MARPVYHTHYHQLQGVMTSSPYIHFWKHLYTQMLCVGMEKHLLRLLTVVTKGKKYGIWRCISPMKTFWQDPHNLLLSLPVKGKERRKCSSKISSILHISLYFQWLLSLRLQEHCPETAHMHMERWPWSRTIMHPSGFSHVHRIYKMMESKRGCMN